MEKRAYVIRTGCEPNARDRIVIADPSNVYDASAWTGHDFYSSLTLLPPRQLMKWIRRRFSRGVFPLAFFSFGFNELYYERRLSFGFGFRVDANPGDIVWKWYVSKRLPDGV